MYKAEGVKLAPPGNTWVSLCVTFRVRARYDQWIVSSPPAPGNAQFRAITASTSTIRVWGKDHTSGGRPFVQVNYPKGTWVTAFIEWSNVGDRAGSVNINNGEIVTSFTCEKLDATKVSNDARIGSNMAGAEIVQGMCGDFAAMEIYASETRIPDYLKKLIIQDQIITREYDEPPAKKIKMSQSDCVV